MRTERKLEIVTLTPLDLLRSERNYDRLIIQPLLVG